MSELESHIVLELANNQDRAWRIFMEPWGDELMLPPHESWRLVCIGVPPAMVTVSLHDEGLAVHGIRRATMRLYSSTKTIWESFQPFDPPDA